MLRTSPYINSYPLFKLTGSSSNNVISSNPYFFSTDTYDGTTLSMQLLGFLDSPTNIKVVHDTICKNESYLFPDGSVSSNISSDTTQYSILAAIETGWDSLIITNLEVIDVNVGVDQTGMNLTSSETMVGYQWLDCNDFNNPITGEINQNFSPSNNGSYAVEITQDNCIDTSICIVVSILNIIENDFGENLEVYPNPTEGELLIDLGDSYSTVSISILDIKGRMIRSKKYGQKQVIRLFVQEPKGVYLLTILAGDKTATIRLIKT